MYSLKAAYDKGIQQALAGQQLDGEDEDSHAARNALIGGAAASPFLGMIGQKPVIHDPLMNPSIPRTKSMEELSRLAQPGDVLMTGKPSGSMFKTFISPTSGSELYHAQPVVGRRKGRGVSVSAGENSDPSWRRQSVKDIIKNTPTIEHALEGEYPDAMLMRPKKGMTPQQMRKFVVNSVQRSQHGYDKNKAVSTLLKELFVPKIQGQENAALPPSICKGNVCSTMPAMSYDAAAGMKVVPGKRPEDIFPPDFLRSEAFEPVAANIASNYRASPALRRAMPYLTRAGLGLGLGAGVYGLSKDPALAGVPLGAMAGGALADKFLGPRKGEPLNTFGFLDQLGHAAPTERGALIKQFAGRRLPAMLAGAGLSYAGGKGLQRLLRRGDTDQEEAPRV